MTEPPLCLGLFGFQFLMIMYQSLLSVHKVLIGAVWLEECGCKQKHLTLLTPNYLHKLGEGVQILQLLSDVTEMTKSSRFNYCSFMPT